MSGINFGDGMAWGAVSQREMRSWARDTRHAVAYRVWFAALGWADDCGYASFGKGRLAAVLGNGEGPRDPRLVSEAIRRAKTLGLIDERSRARELILPGHVFQKNDSRPIRAA